MTDDPAEKYMGMDGETVTAMRLDPELVTIVSVWCHGVIVEEIDPITNERFSALNVQCKDEVKRASLGDYVILKETGAFDVKKPNEFSSQHDLL